MRLDTSFRMEQSMRLAPRIIQAMEILQLPMMALQERIEAEMQSNPVLEMHEHDPEESAEEAAPAEPPERGDRDMVVGEGGGADDYQRASDFEDEFGELLRDGAFRPNRATGERDRKLDAMANTPAPDETLTEYLTAQWAFIDAPPAVRQAGRVIIRNIDEDGFLRIPLEELLPQAGESSICDMRYAISDQAESLPISDIEDQISHIEPPAASQPDAPEDADETGDPAPAVPITTDDLYAALRLVQALEPPGVGARDLRECLVLQLTAEGAAGADVSLELELVRGFLRDIESNRLPHIARRLDKSIDQIKAAIVNLSHLNPRPGSLIGRRNVPGIAPDAIVHVDDAGEVRVEMTDGNNPRLYISRAYKKMAKDRATESKARAFLRNNIRSAQWLIGAIVQRRDTVRRVIEEVFQVQREFLEHGEEALRPLPMADVAGKVGVHVATVSRAVSGKYVQTPRGIFPLRMFFSGGTTTAEGADVAWDAVRVKLKEVIDAEDKANPLSDDQIVKELAKHGVTIARRTVAKYRDIMQIPLARKRKRF